MGGLATAARICAALLILGGMTGPVQADPGRMPAVEVTDGDSFRLDGMRIRLMDIDAFELDQTCTAASGARAPCGHLARAALAGFLDHPDLSCDPRREDRYGRILATCSAGGRDIGAAMVEAGHALAYRKFSDRYVPSETIARRASNGAWAGTFEPPWVHRDTGGAQATLSADGTCAIKGNINSKGVRIYHAPGTRYYGRTRITPDKGERWFCTAAEARAAGWRAPRG